MGNSIYFGPNNGTNGWELHRSDGTAAGTKILTNLETDPGSALPSELQVVDSTLFFSASVGGDTELWKSDGTTAGTTQVHNINSIGGSFPDEIVEFNGIAYFSAADSSNERELWRSDGTSAGTVIASDVKDDSSSSNPMNLKAVGHRLVFFADHPTFGIEPWAFTPGTKASIGAQILKDINEGANDSFLFED